MTILYKPVLIETVEQAEALPEGTQRLQNGLEGLALGWTALVPIEVEEETRDHPGVMLPTNPPRYPQQTRLVTPWEVLADRP